MNNNNIENKVANAPLLRFPEFKDEWKLVRVSDILEFYSTNSYSWDQLDFEEGEIFNLHYGMIHNGLPTMMNVKENKLPFVKEIPKNYTICKEGDVAFADASEDTNDVAKCIEFVNCEKSQIICGLHTIHGRDKLGITELGYKGYAFSSKAFHDQVKKLAQGTKIYSISAKTFSECFVGIPSSEEQKKIAKLLALLDKRIELQKSAIEKLKSLKSAIVEQMFVCNGSKPKVRSSKFEDEWRELRLYDILEKIENGITYNTNEVHGYPMTRIETISSGRINFSKVGYCSDYAKLEKHKLHKGDILLSHINSIPYIGKTAYYNGEQPLYHGMNVLLLRCAETVNPKFFFYMLNTQWFLLKCRVLAKQAVNQASISISDLRKINFKIPSLEEQNLISKNICSIESKIDNEEITLEKLQKQKIYLLSKMFI